MTTDPTLREEIEKIFKPGHPITETWQLEAMYDLITRRETAAYDRGKSDIDQEAVAAINGTPSNPKTLN